MIQFNSIQFNSIQSIYSINKENYYFDLPEKLTARGNDNSSAIISRASVTLCIRSRPLMIAADSIGCMDALYSKCRISIALLATLWFSHLKAATAKRAKSDPLYP